MGKGGSRKGQFLVFAKMASVNVSQTRLVSETRVCVKQQTVRDDIETNIKMRMAC